MLSVLRRPDFRLLFAGVVATMVGESTLLLVLAIWVMDLTGSSSMAGLTIFAIVAPALAAPLLGWAVDRFRRKPFLVVAVVATAVALAPLTQVRDVRDIWLIYTVGVLYGVSIIVVSAALNGLIKEMLPEELLAEANGALQTVRQGLRLVGPLGGAALFTQLGGPMVVALSVVCLLVGAGTIAALRLREERPAPSELHWLGEAAAGVRQLFGPSALRRATVGLAIAVAVLGMTETLIFAYVDLGLHRDAAFVSVIVCVQGIGGLSGGLVAARVVRRIGEIGTIGLGVAFFGVSFVACVYPNLVLIFVAAILCGLGLPLAIVGFNTLMQRITPAPVMGRVAAASEAMISLPQALSIIAGAVLVAFVDFRLLFALMAVGMAVSAWYLWAGRSLSPAVPAEDATPDAAAAPTLATSTGTVDDLLASAGSAREDAGSSMLVGDGVDPAGASGWGAGGDITSDRGV